LEKRVRENLIKNHNMAGVDMGDGYKEFLEHTVRFGLNLMLEDENHPILKWYFMKRDKK